MPIELHFQLHFSNKVNYKKVVTAFINKGWTLFSTERKLIMLNKGINYDWIEVHTQAECDDILLYKYVHKEEIGLLLFYGENAIYIIIDQKIGRAHV